MRKHRCSPACHCLHSVLGSIGRTSFLVKEYCFGLFVAEVISAWGRKEKKNMSGCGSFQLWVCITLGFLLSVLSPGVMSVCVMWGPNTVCALSWEQQFGWSHPWHGGEVVILAVTPQLRITWQGQGLIDLGGEGGLQWKITQFSPSIPYKLKRKWMQLLWYAGANLDIDAIFSRLPWIFLKLLPFCPSLMVLFSNLLAEGRKGRPPGEDSFPGRIGCEHTGNNPTNTWRHNSLTHKNWVLKTASF